jgi:uncharacterized membrane protein
MNIPFIKPIVWVATALAALGAGLIGGVFFAFSSFVMKALARLPAPQAIAAMQSINIAVINPLFMSAFLGTAACCVFLAIYSLKSLQQSDSLCLLAGSLLYLFGSLLTTMIFNVPLNDALAQANPASADSARMWASYLRSWSFWNTVRGVGAILAAASFVAALYLARPSR